jgi:hypothetical protein
VVCTYDCNRCRDESYLAKRKGMKHHRDVAVIIDEEKLFRQPMEYEIVQEIDGFQR